MSKQRIEQMLQDCLDGYEGGLTPEECLSAYNGARATLEPLFRHALSLRVAYANAPREEFRRDARAKLMFAAGQDVSLALSRQPDPEFVALARARFLNAAGATALEALRDVPPPRLAFWINARRRLLESAASPRPSRRFAMAMRYGLSAAVVVIALAIATLAPFSGNSPQSADAQLAVLEQRILSLEQQTSAGQQVSSSELLGVTQRLNAIADTLDDEPVPAVAEKLEGLTARSKSLSKAAPEDTTLAQAQEELDEAQAKLRTFAASVATAEPTTAAAVVSPTEGASTSPTTVATEKPAATTTPAAAPRIEVRTTISKDKTYGLEWLEVKVGNTTILMPSSWRLLNVSGNETGVLTLNDSYLGIDTGGDPSVILVVVPASGQVNAAIKGTSVPLRFGGPDADTIAPDALARATELAGLDDEVVLALHHFVLNVSVP
ncbi:MAG TPA: hypothetical protein VI876_08695 [Dehalococcoidia bacterium]|nr:hypothetical protein [Dehalococcoidia bacterium]